MVHSQRGQMNAAPLDTSAVAYLRNSARGDVIFPEDIEYDEARRVFNHMIDRFPAVIVRCTDSDDVARAIDFAYVNELPVAIRGGGHSVAGHSTCDGGLVIDLSLMKSVTVDPDDRTAIAGAGLTLGELDRATQQHGLATPLGIASITGIAGLTLGGGVGWLNGKHGLTCDNVLSFEIVTADGRKLHASPDENADLYWALRGGGGNFGVVTSFEYRLHRVKRVLGGMVVHPLDRARDVLRFYREFAAASPDELSTLASLGTSPDGDPIVVVSSCYSGPIEDGELVLKPLRKFGSPLLDGIGEKEYLELQGMKDAGFPHGNQHYWKSGFLYEISDEAIEVLIDSARSRPSTLTGIGLQHVHGAATRVAPEATAFAHRAEYFDCPALTQWRDPSEAEPNIQWAREHWNAMKPHFGQGVYLNNLGEEEVEQVQAAYGANYQRLAEIKSRYDPENIFRLNQNVPPAPAR